MSNRLILALLASLITLSPTAYAGPISLVNQGFESPDIGNGASSTWPSQMPTGWDENLASGATLIDPTSGLQAREGEQYMLFQIDNRFGNQYIRQTTTAMLTAGMTYTASVWLGARGNGDSWGSLGIRAGNTLLDWERLIIPGRQSGEINFSEWYELSLSYTATESDTMLGEFLSIELWRDQIVRQIAFVKGDTVVD